MPSKSDRRAGAEAGCQRDVSRRMWRCEGDTSDNALSPRIAAFENSRTKLSMTDSYGLVTQTQRENYLIYPTPPQHTTIQTHKQLSKLLRAVCLFLLRPDCYPQRQRRLVEGAGESKIKTA